MSAFAFWSTNRRSWTFSDLRVRGPEPALTRRSDLPSPIGQTDGERSRISFFLSLPSVFVKDSRMGGRWLHRRTSTSPPNHNTENDSNGNKANDFRRAQRKTRPHDWRCEAHSQVVPGNHTDSKSNFPDVSSIRCPSGARDFGALLGLAEVKAIKEASDFFHQSAAAAHPIPEYALGTWATTPFNSEAERAAAFSHPRYRNRLDTEFHSAVEAKLALTNGTTSKARAERS